MAIVTAFRFTENTGGICVDQESWHIWRRKNWFTDHLHTLVPENLSDQFGVDLIYGGAGHPPYHYEVALTARDRITTFLTERDPENGEPVTVEMLGHVVLEAFREVHSRRIDDKLTYLFGFDRKSFNAGEYTSNGEEKTISRPEVKTRAMKIIQGKETTGYSPLSAPVEACLIGVDKLYGYSAFALKETDGVLGFQSCWFESLGQGRDAAAISFSKHLNSCHLDTRRVGVGEPEGLLILLESICNAIDHYGQNGGFIRFMLLDGDGENRTERIRDIFDERAALSLEIVRAKQGGMLDSKGAIELLQFLVRDMRPVEEIERKLFKTVPDAMKLGKLLRGYKIHEAGVPEQSPERSLFLEPAPVISTSGGEEL
jgi:hypothetical protein